MNQPSTNRPTVAVIGGGVSGIVAAHLLQKNHEVTLFEQHPTLGGHTNTISIEQGPDAGLAVDTGFIVFNEATYPLFIQLLDELQVPSRETEMSFGFHCRQSGLVYAGNTFNGLFAQRVNLINPRFYGFLLEIGRFGRLATMDLHTGDDLGTLEDYIARHRFSPFMVDHYLKPMAAAIWSTPTERVGQFPALSFLAFFRNHGLLSLRHRPKWRTVTNGSHSYVQAFVQRFTGTLALGSTIDGIRRVDGGVKLRCADAPTRRFDRIVIATHADQALRLLDDPSAEEQRLLGAWSYETNHTVLHTDTSVLPPLQRAWSSWNFQRQATAGLHPRVYVSYWMNLLQGFHAHHQYVVSLNRPDAYPENTVIREITYHHPTYTSGSMATQALLPTLNGVRRTWFCGSYFGYGFHEDAVRSSHQAVTHLESCL